MKYKRYKKGVTLMELIMVISIIGIMSAIFLVMLNSSNRTQKELEVEARKVVAVIEEARNLSLTGKNANSGCHNENTFYFTTSNSYGISGCNQVNYTLDNGITFVSGSNFSFTVPHGKISIAPTSIQDIDLQKSGKHYHICVKGSGEIIISGSTSCN